MGGCLITMYPHVYQVLCRQSFFCIYNIEIDGLKIIYDLLGEQPTNLPPSVVGFYKSLYTVYLGYAQIRKRSNKKKKICLRE